MQTGAFAQLILTLVAITSRISSLIGEMIEILQLLVPVLTRLLVVFKPPTVIEMKDIMALPDLTCSSLSQGISGAQPSRVENSRITIERREAAKQSNVRACSDEGQPRKKKKVKKDEIDAIFGF
ncbi:hypothetical protein BDP27DRAFT_1325171 [Rhodocollybia butyracea]|uniref:Uncharacterized protein n=1 Tax=Rhodocollybia butyracea TaxID=206335 RepID=A0A9P5PUQ8_9AGAR|nr:hypothetical protein BDP27DRAFT_1325171 [Rhodocollybia butyracea]